MGFRFQRRIKIAPGLSLNASKSGLGVSVGPRGAKVGLGPRGAHYSVGIPGTGLAYRKQTTISRTKPIARPTPRPREPVSGSGAWGSQKLEVQLVLGADGNLRIVDSQGQPLPAKVVALVKKVHAAELAAFLASHCELLNGGMEEILGVRLGTPSPLEHPRLAPASYTAPKPQCPALRTLHFLEKLLPGRRALVDSENQAAVDSWRAAVSGWERAKLAHSDSEKTRIQDFEQALMQDEAVMAGELENRLRDLKWPRETNVSYELDQQGKTLWLDIDLPEVEDMPATVAEMAATRLKLNLKRKSETQLRKEYMQFVHAIVFRAVGEAFHVLPGLQEVIGSGYSQRPDSATGRVRDDYLLSARVPRARWEEIDFHNLAALDPIYCFGRFELRRDMSKTGIFKAIQPYSPDT